MTPKGILAKLVSFPTTPAVSNLDLIGWVSDYLANHGIAVTLIPSPEGTKANLFATIGPGPSGGRVYRGKRR